MAEKIKTQAEWQREKDIKGMISIVMSNYHNYTDIQIIQIKAILSDSRQEVIKLIMQENRTLDDFAYYGDDVYLKELWETDLDPRLWNYRKYVKAKEKE